MTTFLASTRKIVSFHKTAKFRGAVLISLICAGCGILGPAKYSQVKYYDLGTPASIELSGVYPRIQSFNSNGPFRSKMMYKTQECELHVDEYNRWVQVPEVMLARYLQKAFASNFTDKNADVQVAGTLISFDIDLTRKQTELIVEFQIEDSHKKVLFRKTGVYIESFKEAKPEAFSIAMTAAAKQFALDLKDILTKIKR